MKSTSGYRKIPSKESS